MKVELDDDPISFGKILVGFDLKIAHHHMGTTRMDPSPRFGVVNPECRVHGVRNLYIGGSSVFPTAGLFNPTFTIVALAARLADKIRPELS